MSWQGETNILSFSASPFYYSLAWKIVMQSYLSSGPSAKKKKNPVPCSLYGPLTVHLDLIYNVELSVDRY